MNNLLTNASETSKILVDRIELSAEGVSIYAGDTPVAKYEAAPSVALWTQGFEPVSGIRHKIAVVAFGLIMFVIGAALVAVSFV